MLGLGEIVTLRASGGPVSWEVTGAGTAKKSDTTSIKVMAGERPGTLTVTATAENGCKCSIEFAVLQPIAHMRKVLDSKTRHIKGRPTCGFLADLFLLPNEVSFGALVVREAESLATGRGFYASYTGQGHRKPRGSISKELYVSSPTGATRALGSQVIFGDVGWDDIWSGYPFGKTGGPVTVGSVTWPFSFQYCVRNGSTWYTMLAEDDQHFEVDEKGTCKAYKAGASAEAALGDDDSGYG